jgi:hypothetical protein
MSAYQVSSDHLAYLVGVLANVCSDRRGYVTLRTSEQPVDGRIGSKDICGGVWYELHPEMGITDCRLVFFRLARENARSLDHRYPEDHECPPVPCPIGERFPVVPLRTIGDVAQAIKALDCYEYQACEHPEWERGEVHGWLVALRRYLIRRIPGFADAYEAAEWGCPRDAVAAK